MMLAAETATDIGAGSFLAVCVVAVFLIWALGGGRR